MASHKKHDSPTGPQPRVFGYCRVSTDRQADSGLSLDEQRVKVEARCRENGKQTVANVLARQAEGAAA